ncbi:hypothetical protein ANN_04940 [Periplaneta americana]|uniref:Uncharacterized protein n=1 Tax=Periplaneta americana TaxID=6978 RepID=A0ABQ8TBK4_PERAM|nr:hypothetical protein ANN_04940 [Periplaneta americana]
MLLEDGFRASNTAIAFTTLKLLVRLLHVVNQETLNTARVGGVPELEPSDMEELLESLAEELSNEDLTELSKSSRK